MSDYPCRYRGCEERTNEVWRAPVLNGKLRAVMLCPYHKDLCSRVGNAPSFAVRIRYDMGIPEVWIEPVLVIRAHTNPRMED